MASASCDTKKTTQTKPLCLSVKPSNKVDNECLTSSKSSESSTEACPLNLAVKNRSRVCSNQKEDEVKKRRMNIPSEIDSSKLNISK